MAPAEPTRLALGGGADRLDLAAPGASVNSRGAGGRQRDVRPRELTGYSDYITGGNDLDMSQMNGNSSAFDRPTKMLSRMSMFSSFFLAGMTVITFCFAIIAVPISGANVPNGGIPYPYLDTFNQFPKDYIWQFIAIVQIIGYIICFSFVHSNIKAERRPISQIALVFATMSGTTLLMDYFLQFSIVPVSLMSGEFDGIALLTQYNPHGIFIAMEEIGYLLMGLSFLFFAFAMKSNQKLEVVIKWIFMIAFAITVISLIMISARFGIDRKDRFEVVIISIDWLVLIINCLLLGFVFKRRIAISGDSEKSA